MGPYMISSIIFVGLARLPQPPVSAASAVAVEVEIELATRRILDVNSTLQLPGLSRLLKDVLVGECVEDVRKALLELQVRYSAPFAPALCAAVERAVEQASKDIPAAPKNGHSSRAVPSVA